MGCTHTKEQTIIPTENNEFLKTHFHDSEIFEWCQIFVEKSRGKSNTSSTNLIACINQELCRTYFHQLHPNGDVTRLTNAFFSAYDLNNDGTIDFSEFLHAVSIIRRGDCKEKLALLFLLFDTNHDGSIDRLKLINIMEALYQTKGIDYRDSYNILLRRVDLIIDRLENGQNDGKISKEQFIDNCLL